MSLFTVNLPTTGSEVAINFQFSAETLSMAEVYALGDILCLTLNGNNIDGLASYLMNKSSLIKMQQLTNLHNSLEIEDDEDDEDKLPQTIDDLG